MRSEVLEYLRSQNLSPYSVVKELPYDENDTALFIKNPKRIYVNFPQTVSEPFIQTLGGLTIANEVTTVEVILSSDAKLVPASYEQVVALIKAAKDLTTIQGVNRREVQVDVEYVNDLVVTTVELRYITIT